MVSCGVLVVGEVCYELICVKIKVYKCMVCLEGVKGCYIIN